MSVDGPLAATPCDPSAAAPTGSNASRQSAKQCSGRGPVQTLEQSGVSVPGERQAGRPPRRPAERQGRAGEPNTAARASSRRESSFRFCVSPSSCAESGVPGARCPGGRSSRRHPQVSPWKAVWPLKSVPPSGGKRRGAPEGTHLWVKAPRVSALPHRPPSTQQWAPWGASSTPLPAAPEAARPSPRLRQQLDSLPPGSGRQLRQ